MRNIARSVIGKNAFDTEMIWQAAFMDGFYSPGKERLHALGAIEWRSGTSRARRSNVPLYQLFGGKAREHIELYATSGLPQGLVPPAEAQAMSAEGARGSDDGRGLSRLSGGQRHPAEHRARGRGRAGRAGRAAAAGGPERLAAAGPRCSIRDRASG